MTLPGRLSASVFELYREGRCLLLKLVLFTERRRSVTNNPNFPFGARERGKIDNT